MRPKSGSRAAQERPRAAKRVKSKSVTTFVQSCPEPVLPTRVAKMTQQRTKSGPSVAKSIPSMAKSGPGATKSGPRAAKSGPRAAKSGPRAAKSPKNGQEKPKSQECSKSGPRVAKMDVVS